MSIDVDISKILRDLNDKVRQKPVSPMGNIASATLHQTCRNLTFQLKDFSSDPGHKASCKVLDSGVVELNAETLRRIFDSALNGNLLAGLDKLEQARIGVSLFALHEGFHVVQGVAHYPDVAAVKSTTGRRQFVRFDLKSDIAASLTLATLDLDKQDVGGLGRAYFAYLSAAMNMSFKVFDLPPDNHFKVSRLVSLFASRQSFIHSIASEKASFATLYCSFDEEFTAISLYDISDTGIERLRSAKTLAVSARAEIKTALESNNLEKLCTTLTTLGVFA